MPARPGPLATAGQGVVSRSGQPPGGGRSPARVTSTSLRTASARRQNGGGGEGMQAVGGQLIRGDVVAQFACGRALGQQFLDEVRQLTARAWWTRGRPHAEAPPCRIRALAATPAASTRRPPASGEPLPRRAHCRRVAGRRWWRWPLTWRSCRTAARIDSTSGKYLYSVARPIPPTSRAICDIVTDRRPWRATNVARASSVASRTALRVRRHRVDMVLATRPTRFARRRRPRHGRPLPRLRRAKGSDTGGSPPATPRWVKVSAITVTRYDDDPAAAPVSAHRARGARWAGWAQSSCSSSSPRSASPTWSRRPSAAPVMQPAAWSVLVPLAVASLLTGGHPVQHQDPVVPGQAPAGAQVLTG